MYTATVFHEYALGPLDNIIRGDIHDVPEVFLAQNYRDIKRKLIGDATDSQKNENSIALPSVVGVYRGYSYDESSHDPNNSFYNEEESFEGISPSLVQVGVAANLYPMSLVRERLENISSRRIKVCDLRALNIDSSLLDDYSKMLSEGTENQLKGIIPSEEDKLRFYNYLEELLKITGLTSFEYYQFRTHEISQNPIIEKIEIADGFNSVRLSVYEFVVT